LGHSFGHIPGLSPKGQSLGYPYLDLGFGGNRAMRKEKKIKIEKNEKNENKIKKQKNENKKKI
jgi:hypothetical protein